MLNFNNASTVLFASLMMLFAQLGPRASALEVVTADVVEFDAYEICVIGAEHAVCAFIEDGPVWLHTTISSWDTGEGETYCELDSDDVLTCRCEVSGGHVTCDE